MNSQLLKRILFLVLSITILSACKPRTPNIEFSNAWVRPDPLWESAAGYFTISNTGNSSDTITGISLNFAKFGIIHQSIMEGDVSKMVLLTELDIPAGETIEFKPLVYHIMITGLKNDLSYGDKVMIEFTLEKSGIMMVEAEIRKE